MGWIFDLFAEGDTLSIENLERVQFVESRFQELESENVRLKIGKSKLEEELAETYRTKELSPLLAENWFQEGIEATKARAEMAARQLARREPDALIIANEKEAFWQELLSSFQSHVEEFNAACACESPVDFAERDLHHVWIRTPGYPGGQLYLNFRSGMNDILISLTKTETIRSQPIHLLKGTLDLAVTEEQHIAVRDNRSLMDVAQTVEYLLSKVFALIHSGS